MARNEDNSLAALEYLMNEFFNPSTTNARKHEIEQQLNSFKCLPEFWKLSLFFLTNTSSQYVTMFALSTLETVINQKWASIDWAFKEELKRILYNYLIEKGISAPHFIRSKYAKLLVLIAKQDWPTHYPNFLINILELLKSEPNQLIGLILLRTTSEEFMGLHSSFENGRKDEITRLLHQYIPVVFQLLNSILENLGTKPRHTATATPPPSPTHPSSTPSFSQQLATATFKPDSKALNKEALETVQHLFTWVSINQIPPSIIKAIFNFTNVSSFSQDDHDMCVLAMSTINELLYRKCSPPGSQEFFIQLYYYTLELMRDMTCSSNHRIDTLDPIFVQKLSELLVLIVEQHLWRLELEPQFSALDFLSLLYQLTVQLLSIECYLRCLNVWVAFFKQTKPEKSLKYLDAFLGLLSALLKKIQFSTNCALLREINDDEFDENNETDWTIFLKSSIEVISLIAEHAPLETLNHIVVPWKASYDVYRWIETKVDQQNRALTDDPTEMERLCYAIYDFSSLTQCLARLSPLFFDHENGEVTAATSATIKSLLEKLLESASIATTVKFYNFKSSFPCLTEAFIDNHSQLLAALKTYLIWMTRNDKLPTENLKLIIDITLPVIHPSVPIKISNSAAHLFLALSNLNCAPELVTIPDVAHFINLAPNVRFRDNQTNLIVYSSIVNILFKPWPEDTMNHRNYATSMFFEAITWGFRELTPSSDEGRINEVVENVLPSLSHIVDFCKDFPIAAKKRLFEALETTIQHAVSLFPSYAKYSDVSNCILTFFLNVLRVLSQQMGVEATKNAVQVFLEVAVKEQEAGNFLDKLLQIFQLVIESPGSTYKNFLPGILQLCMDNVYPFLLSHSSERPDAFISLLTLLHSILLHRWQYFYSSQVRLGYSPVYSETEGDAPEPEQLMAVLQVFGQGLLQQDINIFKLSLASLEDLNSKWKLYLNVLLRYNGLAKYQTVLLQSLLEKSQTLLSEDIQISVYNMAAVNFDYFFSTFLPQFIRGIEGITDQQKEILLANFVQNYDKDMPTFVRHLQAFVNDAQHFRLCSMPSGFFV